jgi:uncharacterized protein YdaU (DUF1376 family)
MSRAWMPLYVGDYLADTQHLTTIQHGAYLLLIMAYWQRGGLPNDEEAIAGICRLNRSQWESNRSAIAKLFLSGWKHKRIDRELEKAKVLSEKRAMAGRKGGALSHAKNNNERFVVQTIAKQTGTQSQSQSQNLESYSLPDSDCPASPSLVENLRAKGWARD